MILFDLKPSFWNMTLELFVRFTFEFRFEFEFISLEKEKVLDFVSRFVSHWNESQGKIEMTDFDSICIGWFEIQKIPLLKLM